MALLPSVFRLPLATRLRATLLTGALLATLVATASTAPAPAHAADTATVQVTLTADAAVTNTVYTDETTALSVSGSGFQSIEKGFGGIYLLFGWVDPSGAWQPSKGGATGATYRYAMDDESKPAGYQQFIAFPGSTTEASASGGDITADGSWATTLTVAGSSFEATDRDGNATTVDCLASQCGVITIGAHGVANANNETFTPVSFVSSAAMTASASETSAPTAVPVATGTQPAAAIATADTSAGAKPSSATGWMLGSALALLALLGIGTWALVRRRRAATPPADS
ncbi:MULTISPECIES: hypothetical protein [Subtercola]|uniref:LPXTG cell wall anchor domain-containing protein n=1 Tax=Subtercola vilae TaxID=2056433 RepID=A0A4T2BL93_9MICO|nr:MULTISPECIES: hypothetical protein [Subtercola]MEA9987108.1 hypothetical protein [Subtercola sp. RTI3]TIH32127.1 hypothetical protein D4765_15995 [Subtercola vilae]